MTDSCRRLDLQGAYLPVPAYEKIDFYCALVLFTLIFRLPRRSVVEVQLATIGSEALRDDVLREHPLVHPEFSKIERFVQVVVSGIIIVHAGGDEQAGVRHVKFLGGEVGVHRQSHGRVCGVDTGVDDHPVGKPYERRLILPVSRVLINGTDFEFLVLSRELRWDAVEYAAHPLLVPDRVFRDVFAVQSEDLPFNRIRLNKTTCLHVLHHGLRHSAHQHVFPEQSHNLLVHHISYGMQVLKTFFQEWYDCLVADRPKELFEVQREQQQVVLLRRNHDVLHIGSDGDE